MSQSPSDTQISRQEPRDDVNSTMLARGSENLWMDPQGDIAATDLHVSHAMINSKPLYWFPAAHPDKHHTAHPDKHHTYTPHKGSNSLRAIPQIEMMIPESTEPFWRHS